MISWRPCSSMAAAAGHEDVVTGTRHGWRKTVDGKGCEMAAGEPSYPCTDEADTALRLEAEESERRRRYAWLYDDEDIWATI